MENIKYIGCFFDFETLHRKLEQYDRKSLYRQIPNPHITFSYRPQEIPWEAFGLPVKVKAVAYGCDGENEALFVEFTELPQSLEQLAGQIKIPHITLSVSETGEAVNSSKLRFEPIPPFELEGVFGGMDESGAVHLEAPL